MAWYRGLSLSLLLLAATTCCLKRSIDELMDWPIYILLDLLVHIAYKYYPFYF